MESDFPSNSKLNKATPKKVEPKKIEKVVTGEVVTRKKPLGKRFKETFISGADSKSVLEYVLFDILIPYSKDMVLDATQAGLERKFYGETRSASRRNASRFVGGFTAYNRMNHGSSSNDQFRHHEETRGPSRRARAAHNFDEIILATRAEATEVIDQLFAVISQYEIATVADLYELVGVPSNFTDNNWGWTDIRGADVTRVRSGYLLDLPRPEPID